MTLALISVYGTKPPEREMYERNLYDLLSEREPYQNISHRVMPTYEKHVEFVRSKPYAAWYVIYDKDFIGSAYLSKKDEIGLHIRKYAVHQGYGRKIINIIMAIHKRHEYYANISPLNSNSLAFFCNIGFNHHKTMWSLNPPKDGIIQYTYRYVNESYKIDPLDHFIHE